MVQDFPINRVVPATGGNAATVIGLTAVVVYALLVSPRHDNDARSGAEQFALPQPVDANASVLRDETTKNGYRSR